MVNNIKVRQIKDSKKFKLITRALKKQVNENSHKVRVQRDLRRRTINLIKIRRLGNEIDKPLVLLDADDAKQRVQSLGYKMKAESPRKIMHLNGL